MENLQAAVALLVGVVVMFFVPALVWATVIAGLIQIVREKVRKSHLARARQPRRAQLPVRWR